MDVFLVGTLLILIGLVIAFAGYPLFRILLPVMGFFAGFGLGFSMIQAVAGSNVLSFAVALLTAIVTGIVIAALSYAYYTVGILLVAASLMAGVFAYLGQAVGLRENGFVVGLLSITGAIIGIMTVLKYGLHHDFIVVISSMFGVGMIFVGVFLMFGDYNLADLSRNGISQSIGSLVTSSWLWLIAWIGGVVIALQAQMIMIARAVFGDQFVIEETKKK